MLPAEDPSRIAPPGTWPSVTSAGEEPRSSLCLLPAWLQVRGVIHVACACRILSNISGLEISCHVLFGVGARKEDFTCNVLRRFIRAFINDATAAWIGWAVTAAALRAWRLRSRAEPRATWQHCFSCWQRMSIFENGNAMWAHRGHDGIVNMLRQVWGSGSFYAGYGARVLPWNQAWRCISRIVQRLHRGSCKELIEKHGDKFFCRNIRWRAGGGTDDCQMQVDRLCLTVGFCRGIV